MKGKLPKEYLIPDKDIEAKEFGFDNPKDPRRFVKKVKYWYKDKEDL